MKTTGELCLQGVRAAWGLPEERLKCPCKDLQGRLGERVRRTILSYHNVTQKQLPAQGQHVGPWDPTIEQ